MCSARPRRADLFGVSARSDRETLIIDDGSPAALAACLLETSPGRVLAWFPPTGAPAIIARLCAVRRRVDQLGLGGVVEASARNEEAFGVGSLAPAGEAGPIWSGVLLDAIGAARRRGIGRVVWPAHFGDDLEGLSRAARRVRRVADLAAVDASGDLAVRLAAPLLDLGDAQVADLLDDLDAPPALCWWCDREGTAACGGCEGCRRWGGLLVTAGSERRRVGSRRGMGAAGGAAGR